MPLNSSTNFEEIQDAVDGNETAAHRIYRKCIRLVWVWCNSYGINATDRDDVTQNIFIHRTFLDIRCLFISR